jgi:hypothetical protein
MIKFFLEDETNNGKRYEFDINLNMEQMEDY